MHPTNAWQGVGTRHTKHAAVCIVNHCTAQPKCMCVRMLFMHRSYSVSCIALPGATNAEEVARAERETREETARMVQGGVVVYREIRVRDTADTEQRDRRRLVCGRD